MTLALGVGLWAAGLWLAPSALFPIGHFICHQRPERSFFVGRQQLPVCARCSGLYAGAALAGPFAIALASGLASGRARWVLGLAAAPTLVTWALEFAGLVPFSSAARFAAALPLGFAAAWLTYSVIAPNRAGTT
jgi:uncharacterized membrane protein